MPTQTRPVIRTSNFPKSLSPNFNVTQRRHERRWGLQGLKLEPQISGAICGICAKWVKYWVFYFPEGKHITVDVM